MTAEIAILNKTAVALAADSAVTISAGSDQQKIYDSEDKLFELTKLNAIGVMINNTMNFMETPLPVLIKRYREGAPRFKRLKDAANHFLSYLDSFVQDSPERIQDDVVSSMANNVFDVINNRAQEEYKSKFFEPETQNIRSDLLEDPESLPDKAKIFLSDAYEHQIAVLERLISRAEDAQFIGGEFPEFTDNQRSNVKHIAETVLSGASNEQQERSIEALKSVLRKRGLEEGGTGLIVAGFGDDDLFPTLAAYQIYGAFGGRLKFAETEIVDIDRDGEKARVLPFAQREMVERFLYGLDTGIEQTVSRQSKSAVSLISDRLLDALDMSQNELAALRETVDDAETEFAVGLGETFAAIRADSRTEIEDMVEFMPKPEMARMAEALVNLTSIKRRVSRGFETVGGPIDVAVISKAEGFVWVSRKHYFPRELNERYFARMYGNKPILGGENG